jgi:hypothetical protein
MSAAQHKHRDDREHLCPARPAGTSTAMAIAERKRATRQRARRLMLLAAMLCAAAGSAVAQEQAAANYNVVITDGGAGALVSFTRVCVYSVDSVENVRLVADPVVQFPSRTPDGANPAPANPMFVLLTPGRYELTVSVPWLRGEVTYMYFVVEAERVSVVDVLSVELPAELMTY